MITYTGLVTLMMMYMPWGAQTALKTPDQRQQLSVQLNAFIQPGKPSGVSVPLAPIGPMVREAQARWGAAHVGRVTVTQPGDRAVRVAVSRGESSRVSMSPQYMLFDGGTGKLLDVKDTVGAAAETRGVLYALHLGRFSDLTLRCLYFIVSLAGTAMVGTGLVMWTVKRRQKLTLPGTPPLLGFPFGFWLVERLNITSIAGLSVAMTGFLWGNRLLPVGLAARANAEINVFFALWGLALLYAFFRPAKKAWIELLWLAAALLAFLPALNAITTQRSLWISLAHRDWVYVWFDLMMLVFAILHAMLALRTARHRPRETRERT
jgi:uncharacterized iron-regulated membrane protein